MKKLSVLILVLGLADVASAALVGQWTFEGSVATNSGTAGAAADGTLVNEASYLFDGTTIGTHNFGTVLDLSGPGGAGDDYMNVGGDRDPNTNPTPTWSENLEETITMWVKYDVDPSTLSVIGLGGKMSTGAYPADANGNPPNTWYFEGGSIYGGQVEFKSYSGGPLSQPLGPQHRAFVPYGVNVWQHYALVVSEADQESTVYIDGVFDSTLALPAGGRTMGFAETWFGAIKRWPAEGHQGQLDDIRYYDEALSAAEIALIVNPVLDDGDFDGDGDVDGNDFLVWQRGFGTTYDATDLAVWESNYGSVSLVAAATGSAAAVPEPTSASLLILSLSALVLVGRRRRGGIGNLLIK